MEGLTIKEVVESTTFKHKPKRDEDQSPIATSRQKYIVDEVRSRADSMVKK